MPDQTTLTLHATAVALEAKGLLILGKSGSGKSSLALALMAYGAALVADDQTILTANQNGISLTCPTPTRNLIEARGIGLLNATAVPSARLHTVIDLDQIETERLPKPHKITLLGHNFPLLKTPQTTNLATALLHYLKAGRSTP